MDIWEESGDGRGRYEGELFLDGMKYEFEIDPQTGRIFDWNADLRIDAHSLLQHADLAAGTGNRHLSCGDPGILYQPRENR